MSLSGMSDPLESMDAVERVIAGDLDAMEGARDLSDEERIALNLHRSNEQVIQQQDKRIEALEAENKKLNSVLHHVKDHLYGAQSAYFVRPTTRSAPHYLVGEPLEIVNANHANSAASACTFRSEAIETCAEAIEWAVAEQPAAEEEAS